MKDSHPLQPLIDDPHCTAPPPGTPGELLIRGPNIMREYILGEGKSQAGTFTEDGFLRTGDIAYVDENGFLFLVDRAKEMIKVKG